MLAGSSGWIRHRAHWLLVVWRWRLRRSDDAALGHEFFIWWAIAAFLWHMGKKSINGARPRGEIFCGYLILTGVARFLIEFIRINPRSFFGFSNAQAASLVSIVIGVILFCRIRSSSTLQSKSS